MKRLDRQFGSCLSWWRERVRFEQKAAIAAFVLGGLLIGGWLAADSFSSSGTSTQVQTVPVSAVRTVDKVFRIRDPRKTVTVVRVVKPVYRTRTDTLPAATVVQTQTAYGTSTVTIPRYVTHVVTAPAPAQTITETRTVTDLTTTVEWRVITVVEKSKPVTVTVPAPAP